MQVLFSLLLVPLFVLVHPPQGELANGLLVPQLPPVPDGGLANVMLLMIGIVGTTVAPGTDECPHLAAGESL